MVRTMLGVQLKDIKRSTDLMFTLGLSETIDQMAMAKCWLVWPCVWTVSVNKIAAGLR